MITPEIFATLLPAIEAFENLNIRYHIGGSIASSFHGIPRSTLDVDLVADLKHHHVEPLVKRLGTTYYIDGMMMHEAIDRQGSFNLIHNETFLKLDVFVLKTDHYDQLASSRAQEGSVDDPASRTFYLASPEDTVLHKLYRYRLGDGVSERQWTDVLGVLKTQGDALDLAYMHRWAKNLKVRDLLDKALTQAGIMLRDT